MRFTIAPVLFSMLAAAQAQELDIVLSRGRVMDPASGLDAARDVGILSGKIAAISEAPLRGRTVVDATGLVIAPGFIDLHSHGQTPENYRFKARDGVTAARSKWRWAFRLCPSGIGLARATR